MKELSINELIDFGENAIEKGKKFGADDIEVYLSYSRNNRANVYTGYVDSFGGRELGVGVRAVIGKKLGFSSTTVRSKKEIIDAIQRATKIAKIKEEDPHFHHLPDPKQGKGEPGLFDEKIRDLALGELTKLAKESADQGEEVGNFVKNINVTAEAGVVKNVIISTRGIKRGTKGTYYQSFCSVKGEEDEELTTGSEIVVGRELEENKLLKIGKKAAERAESMFNGKKIENPVSGELVLENTAIFSFLWPLIYNINGNNIADKRSRFQGKLDKKVASDITIVDDGTLPEGLRTAEVDGEGTPMTKTKIIEDGKLKNYLFNSYAALRMEQERSGNCGRSDYSSPPSLSHTNLCMPHGSGTMEDLKEEIDYGVLVTGGPGVVMGSHLTNPIKGNFGLTCKNAFLIENGEVEYPLKEVTVSGNFFEFLQNIIKVGGDTKLTQAGKLPSILAKDIDFA